MVLHIHMLFIQQEDSSTEHRLTKTKFDINSKKCVCLSNEVTEMRISEWVGYLSESQLRVYMAKSRQISLLECIYNMYSDPTINIKSVTKKRTLNCWQTFRHENSLVHGFVEQYLDAEPPPSCKCTKASSQQPRRGLL